MPVQKTQANKKQRSWNLCANTLLFPHLASSSVILVPMYCVYPYFRSCLYGEWCCVRAIVWRAWWRQSKHTAASRGLLVLFGVSPSQRRNFICETCTSDVWRNFPVLKPTWDKLTQGTICSPNFTALLWWFHWDCWRLGDLLRVLNSDFSTSTTRGFADKGTYIQQHRRPCILWKLSACSFLHLCSDCLLVVFCIFLAKPPRGDVSP